MTHKKQRKIVIELAVIMAFIFGIIVAFLAYKTGSLLMGLIFLGALQIIILLAILFLMESMLEIVEAKL